MILFSTNLFTPAPFHSQLKFNIVANWRKMQMPWQWLFVERKRVTFVTQGAPVVCMNGGNFLLVVFQVRLGHLVHV